MNIDLTEKRLIHKIEFATNFPTGTPEQIYEELCSTKEDFLKNHLHTYSNISEDMLIKGVTFEDMWSGYEDHEYYLVVTLEETDEAYNIRQEKALRIRKKQAEDSKRKIKADKAKIIKNKQDEIRKLEEKLTMLKSAP